MLLGNNQQTNLLFENILECSNQYNFFYTKTLAQIKKTCGYLLIYCLCWAPTVPSNLAVRRVTYCYILIASYFGYENWINFSCLYILKIVCSWIVWIPDITLSYNIKHICEIPSIEFSGSKSYYDTANKNPLIIDVWNLLYIY